MNPIGRKGCALLLALLLALSFSGCSIINSIFGAKFDAAGYVQGGLDCLYKGEFDQYMELTEATEEEAKQTYEEGLEAEADVFEQYIGAEGVITDASRAKIIELYKSIYAKSNYSVKLLSETNGVYVVEVVIHPIDIFTNCYDDATAYVDSFYEKDEAGEFDGLTDEEYSDKYIQGLLDLYTAYVPEIGYNEAKTLTVQVKQDDSGLYTLSDEDMQNIDTWIIEY